MSPADIIAEHTECTLPTDELLSALARDGVDLAALVRRWEAGLDIPRLDRVVYMDGVFEFAAYVPDRADHAGALIFVVRDHIGDAVDLAAWSPPRAPALWLASGSMLGAENVFAPRMRDALPVHAGPLEWLRDSCRGVVVVDETKAADLLRRAEPLQAASVEHGRQLRHMLEVKPPRILVPSAREAA